MWYLTVLSLPTHEWTDEKEEGCSRVKLETKNEDETPIKNLAAGHPVDVFQTNTAR